MKKLFVALAAVCWLAQAWAQPVLSSGRPVTLVFAGDTVLDDDPGALIARGGDPFADFSSVFAGADIRIANLECVVATGGSAGQKNFTFRAHPRVLPVLKTHFDGVALANNHSGDFGREAFAEMLGLLKKAGLAQVGGGRNLKEAHAPWIIERHGLRIAILSYNEFIPRSFEADHDAPGVAWSEDEQVVDDIRQARQVHRADLVIPIMHWGWENEVVANSRQRQLARLMVAAGADAVIGGHPHVTQDIEHILGKPVIYSVGNFVMKETDNANQRRGWVLRLVLDKQGVRLLDTRVAQIRMDGIPERDDWAASPCWQRGDAAVGQCVAGQRPEAR
ncbi:poly-gamma-glutamate biosynthesis protein [Limnohabitans sp. 2KL-17]|uniref:CapA family protein n=1 Tax=Limnohabitans sp. 2KL-17 TaxID=1100704 RepID=UPI000D3C5765|nr:CapA family protein [Limnohabitans sp. 2KL-17]PUE61693.1 poly-gamma-glutamate biosynthesis protein [Limnohabitans sp. 2KL-17]